LWKEVNEDVTTIYLSANTFLSNTKLGRLKAKATKVRVLGLTKKNCICKNVHVLYAQKNKKHLNTTSKKAPQVKRYIN
jgi:hypothetical protein